MWTWGHGDFGEMWCSNLTDENGPYIELMTGVYTDNQPDFTWIAPYESREFEQYWYPIREIGDVKNATIDAAMNFEACDGGAIWIKRGEPFAQNMGDQNDDMIRRKIINLSVEYLTAD